MIEFTLNGQPVKASADQSIFNIAKDLGIAIPHLCHSDGLRPDGNCRACVVEIAGERTLAPSCCRSATPGMQVQTNSERAVKSQNMVLEMLLADLPEQGHKWLDDRFDAPHGELSQWAQRQGVQVRPALAELRRVAPVSDLSHPAMAVNLDACIQCNRCERACREIQVNNVIGLAGRGAHTQVVFDLADPMGASSCVACGECVQACPTGALMPKGHIGAQSVDREVDSVCPFCGVGCLVTLKVKDEKIVSVEGRNGPANEGRLCVKGRFGMDYVHSPDRLTKPLIRIPHAPKDVSLLDNRTDWRDVFREATWEEALDAAARPLHELKEKFGHKALAGFGSAKGSNEEAYLFQKLVRTGFGSNNVDHCTRLCHASSVSALLEGVGSGAVSNPVRDVEHSELIIVIGSNPTNNHPVAATWMKNAAQRGTRIVLMDPRVTDIARHAWRTLPFKADRVTADRIRVLADLWNTVGRMSLEKHGMKLGCHHEFWCGIRSQDEIDQFYSLTDPAYVNLYIDTAQHVIAGVDPVALYRQYAHRVNGFHFKDTRHVDKVEDYRSQPDPELCASTTPRWFWEMGTPGGLVDFPALMQALKEHDYEGWIGVEHDKADIGGGSYPESTALAMWYARNVLEPIYYGKAAA